MIAVLSDFATNVTRYYSLDFVTDASRIQGLNDPIKAWHETAIDPILARHYKPKRKLMHEARARKLDKVLSPYMHVLQTSEDGQEINSVMDAFERSDRAQVAQPYVRMYLMQIVRFLSS